VLRRDNGEAVQVVIAYLVKAGTVSDASEARELVDQAEFQPVVVIS
jgi:hypothetical protein